MKLFKFLAFTLVLTLSFSCTTRPEKQTDLASWNEGPAKQAIIDFVHATTDKESPHFVPPEERVATFDQDGTLWVEQPLYSQAIYAIDRLRVLAS